jgi:hypothetical protein
MDGIGCGQRTQRLEKSLSSKPFKIGPADFRTTKINLIRTVLCYLREGKLQLFNCILPQLLVTSLDKLKPKVTNSQHSLRQSSIIYNESALTLEKLSILKAWAEVYVASMKNETNVKTDFTTSAAPSCSPGNGEPEKEAEQDEEDFGDFESTR